MEANGESGRFSPQLWERQRDKGERHWRREIVKKRNTETGASLKALFLFS